MREDSRKTTKRKSRCEETPIIVPIATEVAEYRRSECELSLCVYLGYCSSIKRYPGKIAFKITYSYFFVS